MKRLFVCITLLLFLLIPASSVADTDTIGQISLAYEAVEGISRIGIYSPQLADFSLGRGGAIGGMFTNAVSSLVCLNAACTKLSIDVDISGITLNDVPLRGIIYPTLYFSGTLDFAGTLFKFGQNRFCPDRGICFTGESIVSGNLTACIDPACSTQLFQLDTRPNMYAYSSVGVVFDSNGQGVLEGASFVNPEPATLLLFGTGLAGIGWRKFHAIGKSSR